jgi:hypothetical protein
MAFHLWIYCTLIRLTLSITLPYLFPLRLLFNNFQYISLFYFSYTDVMYFYVIHYHCLFLSFLPQSPQIVPLLQTCSLSLSLYIYMSKFVFVCMLIFLLYLPHMREDMRPLSFWTWLTSLNEVSDFQFHPFTCKWHNLILPYGWIILHCAYILHFLILSSFVGHLGCFQILAIMNSAALNTGLWVSLLYPDFRYMYRSGIARSLTQFLRLSHLVMAFGEMRWWEYMWAKKNQSWREMAQVLGWHVYC